MIFFNLMLGFCSFKKYLLKGNSIKKPGSVLGIALLCTYKKNALSPRDGFGYLDRQSNIHEMKDASPYQLHLLQILFLD